MMKEAQEILAYLADHPEAKDRLEGIVEWWILEQRIRVQVSAVKTALWMLVEDGLLVVDHHGNRGPLYRVNPGKLDQIQQMVRSAKRADGSDARPAGEVNA